MRCWDVLMVVRYVVFVAHTACFLCPGQVFDFVKDGCGFFFFFFFVLCVFFLFFCLVFFFFFFFLCPVVLRSGSCVGLFSSVCQWFSFQSISVSIVGLSRGKVCSPEMMSSCSISIGFVFDVVVRSICGFPSIREGGT